jgi:TRAP-type C4-dicarboxylate transport system permease small subunit
MDLLPLMLSKRNRSRLAMLTSLVVLVFLVVFFYYSGEHTLRVRASGQLTPVMQAPMWLTYLAMPVGSALMIIRTCQLLWRAFKYEYELNVDLQD